MNSADENIIITVIKMKDGNKIEEKDMSVPVTSKISEIFPDLEARKIVALSGNDSFETAGVLYGDILEIK